MQAHAKRSIQDSATMFFIISNKDTGDVILGQTLLFLELNRNIIYKLEEFEESL